MADVVITPENNGPYHITGKFKLVTEGGREIDVDGDETWLCRCGHSADKPFCDGTHEKVGFKSNLDEQAEAPAGQYVAVANAEEIDEAEIVGVRVAGQPVVLAKIDGTIYAVAGVCTHKQALLEEGELDREVLVCPRHNAGFNVKTGKATQLPAELPVQTYDVQIDGGKVLVSTMPRRPVEA